MAKPGLTVSMIVRDERDNLTELLPTLRGRVDDLVIVDTGSGDGTPDLAREHGARVFERPWDDDFAAARNRGLEEIRTSHVLWLDADDRIEPADLQRLRDALVAKPARALQLLLVNESADPGNVTSCWQLRAFPANPVHRFEGRVHEQILPSLRRSCTPVENLDVTVRHEGYVRPDDVLRKSRRNLELLRREAAERPGEDDVNVLYHWMKSASRCGELEEAVGLARRLADTPPRGTPTEVRQAAAAELGRLEAQRGRVDEGIAALVAAVDRVPDDPIARFFLADLLRRKSDLVGALDHLLVARVSPVRPGNLPVPVAGLARVIRISLGETLERLGRHADAAGAYREILVDRPEDTASRAALVRSLVGAGDFKGAATEFAAIPDGALAPNQRLRLEALIAFGRHRDVEAGKLFEQLEKAEPRHWGAPLHRGHLALRGGRIAEAREHLERALSRADQPEVRVGLAAACLEAGDPEACLEHCAVAIEASRGQPMPAGTEALSGEALARLGRYPEARNAFEMHLKRLGPEPRILSRLADCYREEGASQAARTGYEAALRLAPDLGEARQGLEALGAGN